LACSPVLPLRFADARILIFAKAPEPGQVKTRLIPVLGARGAADLQARLLRDTMARLAATRLASIELWCAPDCLREPFPELADRYRLGIHGQRGTELGERMLHAATDALRRGDKVVLVGTDCPSLDGAYLEQALMALEGHDAVLGPAEDGGYGLLGLKRAAETLFRDMPWGSDRVAELTRNRMEGLAWQWAELPLLWDLDRPEDLERLDRFF
jgi:rSAM/selenodomain-associated transferase 1